jgi:hypothetical protein
MKIYSDLCAELNKEEKENTTIEDLLTSMEVTAHKTSNNHLHALGQWSIYNGLSQLSKEHDLNGFSTNLDPLILYDNGIELYLMAHIYLN